MKVSGLLVNTSHGPYRPSRPLVSRSFNAQWSSAQPSSVQPSVDELANRQLQIYVSKHCENCDHARQVARELRDSYPPLRVEVIELEAAYEQKEAEIPDAVFATPTYLLDGRVWSLGNPSPEKIVDTFGPPRVA